MGREHMDAQDQTALNGLGNKQVKVLLQVGRNQGLSDRQLLANTLLFDHADDYIDVNPEQELMVIRNLIDYVNQCPFQLGFNVGLQSKLHSFGLIGQSMLSSQTIDAALQVSLRFLSKVFYYSAIELNIESGQATLHFRLTLPMEPEVMQFIVARDLGIATYVLDMVVGKHSSDVHEIGFAFPRLQGMECLEDYFDCPIFYEQPENYIRGDVRALSKEMPFSNPVTARALEQQCYEQLSKLEKIAPMQSTLHKVWSIIEQTQDFNLSRDEAAKLLNMSARTLNRRLQDEDTNWRRAVADFRINKAAHLLRYTRQNIQTIADYVGFSSASALSAAFARAKGCSPLSYRERFISEKDSDMADPVAV